MVLIVLLLLVVQTVYQDPTSSGLTFTTLSEDVYMIRVYKLAATTPPPQHWDIIINSVNK